MPVYPRISPDQIDVRKLLGLALGQREKPWRIDVEIVTDLRGRNDPSKKIAGCYVRWKGWFLRYSKGPFAGHFWDAFGEDYQSPELALLAILEAPSPAHLTPLDPDGR